MIDTSLFHYPMYNALKHNLTKQITMYFKHKQSFTTYQMVEFFL